MVNKVINDFDLVLPVFGDGMLCQQGGLPTGTTKRFLPESLNQLFMGNNIVPVYQESDIGVAVSGELFLESNKTYLMFAPIVTSNTWVLGDNTNIIDVGASVNSITFLGAVAIKIVNATLNQINNIFFLSGGATQLFDINSASGGVVNMEGMVASGFAALGNVNGVVCTMHRVNMINFTEGLTFNNGGFIGVDFSSFQTSAVTTIFDFSGTFTQVISLTGLALSTGVGGFGSNFDNALVVPGVTVRDIGLIGGTMFDPTGLDGTEINFRVSGVSGVKDSQVVGIMSMSENAVETTINTQNIYESIEGTTVPGVENERITHSGNILKYIGLESTTASIHAVMSGVAAVSTALYDFAFFKNNVLIPNAVMRNELSGRTQTTPLQFLVNLNNDDDIEVKVRNIENVVNLTISDLIVTITAGI